MSDIGRNGKKGGNKSVELYTLQALNRIASSLKIDISGIGSGLSLFDKLAELVALLEKQSNGSGYYLPAGDTYTGSKNIMNVDVLFEDTIIQTLTNVAGENLLVDMNLADAPLPPTVTNFTHETIIKTIKATQPLWLNRFKG